MRLCECPVPPKLLLAGFSVHWYILSEINYLHWCYKMVIFLNCFFFYILVYILSQRDFPFLPWTCVFIIYSSIFGNSWCFFIFHVSTLMSCFLLMMLKLSQGWPTWAPTTYFLCSFHTRASFSLYALAFVCPLTFQWDTAFLMTMFLYAFLAICELSIFFHWFLFLSTHRSVSHCFNYKSFIVCFNIGTPSVLC